MFYALAPTSVTGYFRLLLFNQDLLPPLRANKLDAVLQKGGIDQCDCGGTEAAEEEANIAQEALKPGPKRGSNLSQQPSCINHGDSGSPALHAADVHDVEVAGHGEHPAATSQVLQALKQHVLNLTKKNI
jgi:hypothetical protein